jgi:tetratricopeptide (TPR) repeat protein/plasmid stabilization system protein ParE
MAAATAVAATAAAAVRPSARRFSDVMRSKAENYASLGMPSSARFLADKAAAFSPSPDDVLRLARIHAAAGHHRRALRTLGVDGTGDATRGPASSNASTSSLTESSLPARLLAAQCLYAVADFDECLAVLGDASADQARSFNEGTSTTTDQLATAHPPSYRRRAVVGTGATASKGVAASTQHRHHNQNQLPFTSTASDSPEIRAALCVMRARVSEELENMERAAWWYKRALIWDVYCYEAFVRLTEAGLLSSDDAIRFANELHAGRGDEPLWTHMAYVPTTGAVAAAQLASSIESAAASAVRTPQRGSQPSAPGAGGGPSAPSPPIWHSDARNWICAFYRVRVDQSGPPPPAPPNFDLVPCHHSSSVAEEAERAAIEAGQNATCVTAHTEARTPANILVAEPGMAANLDVMTLRAVRLYDALDFDECVLLTRSIMSRDPGIEHRVVLVHLAALVEMDLRHELFVMAHALVDQSPRDAVSWMAVGYYYFACGKHELARRYLQKATGINPRLGPAWLAFGHAFGAQDESDQAMASYRTAARLLPGAQLPLLFMGMEYARQSSLTHAASFFQAAREACPCDPAPRHELGVIALRSGDLKGAVAYFKSALSLWETSDGLKDVAFSSGRRAEAEEATLFNLGHCYRRLREFARAKQCYERALSLRPRSASTCSALGMTVHAMGDFTAAIALYHRALRYNPEDALSVVMLDRALEDMSKNMPV